MAKRGKGNQIAIWVIVGLICFAMIGFGATSFGNNVTSIGKVGDRDITASRYFNALAGELRRLEQQTGQQIPFAQAQLFGIDQGVLQQVVASAALENEAAELGLSVGDNAVRDQVLALPAFQGLDGSFDREAYAQTLRRNGMNERDFEADIRAEISRALLTNSVAGGVVMPTVYADTLFAYAAERRSFTWVTLRPEDLEAPVADPTDAELRTYYDENEALFTLPETKRITYAWLTPEMVLDQIEVPEADLQELYDIRISEFVQPERRLVERLVLGDAAEDARARIDAGEITFEALVAERGLELTDIDMGDVTEADLGEAGPEVFASDLGVIGPLPSDFGPALFRVNAILSATETTFDEARPDLERELALIEAAELVTRDIETVDDLLAGGATLEELEADTDMTLGQVDWFPGAEAEIAQFAAFNTAAAAAREGDFPEVLDLDDGGIFALRVDEVIAPRLEAFEDVRERATEGWRAQATVAVLAAQAEALAQSLQADNLPEGVETTFEEHVTREQIVPGAGVDTVGRVFELELGLTDVIEGPRGVTVVRLDRIEGPDMDDPDLAARRAGFLEAGARVIGTDILNAYALAIQNEAGLTLDQAAINAVHVNLP